MSLGLAVGLCAVFLGRPAWRWIGGALCLAACTAGLSMLAVYSGVAAPDVRLTLAAPAAASEPSSPVEIHVCGATAAGAPVTLPGAGRLLAVLVDGRSIATEPTPLFAVALTPGAHRLQVELVDSAHRAFSPPVTVMLSLRVASGPAPLGAAGSCRG